MSVYDIKDHPDYKFRPGNTVIRVGGFEVRYYNHASSRLAKR